MSESGERRFFVLAVAASLALHLGLSIVVFTGRQEVPRAEVEVKLELSEDVPLAGGPLALRQDLPPQRAPEVPPVPQPEAPTPEARPDKAPDIGETIELPEQLPSPEPEAVQEASTPAGTESDTSLAVDTLATAAPVAPRDGIASGGFVGGTGLPGGGTSAEGSSTGGASSSGEQTATAARRFIPYFKVDHPPKMVQKAVLEYPEQAKRRNLEATVILEADIDESGKVEEVRVVKPAGFGFDEAAVKYVQASIFSPASIGEKPVAVLMRFTIRFTLSD